MVSQTATLVFWDFSVPVALFQICFHGKFVDKQIRCSLYSSKQNTDKIRKYLVDIAEHFTAKETLQEAAKTKTDLKAQATEYEFRFLRKPKCQLQMNC